jgi:RimJ/RimL family protein N-acetyltransferase
VDEKESRMIAPVPAPILTTARLSIRELTSGDAAFMLALLNDPGWTLNIGDRGVRTGPDAARYIEERITVSYRTHGFGFYLVEMSDGPIGICGFVHRDGLPAPDLGFAYLASHVGRGYGREAGEAMLHHGREVLGLSEIIAFIRPGNAASAALLRRLGFVEAGPIQVAGYAGGSLLFRHAFPGSADGLGGPQARHLPEREPAP